MIPNNYKLLFSKNDIAQAVKRLGKEIGEWSEEVQKNTKSDLITVPILRGSLFFFADLVREIKTSIEIAPVEAWAYDPSKNAPSEISMRLTELPLKGRAVLIVDDICDTGRTLIALRNELRKRGAHDVRAAVLVQRSESDPAAKPDYVGLNYSTHEWLVGYGMDDSNRWRNLPEIYIIAGEKEEVAESRK